MGALLTAVVGFLVRSVLLKFVSFTVLYLFVSAAMGYLTSHLSSISPTALTSAISAWTPEMWYFVDLTLFSQGFPAIVSAYVLRFAIRRMPIVG